MPRPTDFLLRLVVIDDEPMNLNLIRDALADQSVEIFLSSDPQEGLELVRSKHPHLVLLDFMMPHLSGMEILEQIVEMDPGTDVILMTGHYSPELAVEAIQKGASDFSPNRFPSRNCEIASANLSRPVGRGSTCCSLRPNSSKAFSLKASWAAARRCWTCFAKSA